MANRCLSCHLFFFSSFFMLTGTTTSLFFLNIHHFPYSLRLLSFLLFSDISFNTTSSIQSSSIILSFFYSLRLHLFHPSYYQLCSSSTRALYFNATNLTSVQSSSLNPPLVEQKTLTKNLAKTLSNKDTE